MHNIQIFATKTQHNFLRHFHVTARLKIRVIGLLRQVMAIIVCYTNAFLFQKIQIKSKIKPMDFKKLEKLLCNLVQL